MKKPVFLLLLPILTLFSSCFAEIGGTLMVGGAAELTLKTTMGPRTTLLVRSLRSFMGSGGNAPILDAAAISRSMALASGVKAVSLKNTSPEAMEGNISLSNIGDFLSSPESGNRFITFTEGPEASTIVISLDRASAPQIISRLSPEIIDYLSALMAPVALGDIMSAREYIDLLASIYSRPLANEIAEGRIHTIIEFPRTVKSVQGGTFSGRKVEFDIPLLDILVLERSLRYEVSW